MYICKSLGNVFEIKFFLNNFFRLSSIKFNFILD